MRRDSHLPVKYEAPRLQTYGKLESLTKGSAQVSADSDSTLTKN